MSSGRRTALGHASRVAAITAVVFLVMYIAVAGILDLALFGRLASQPDQHLANALKLAGTRAANPAVSNAKLGSQLQNPDEAPVFLWEVHAGNRVVPLMAGAPALPARPWQAASPSTVSLPAGRFRIEAAREPYGWLVAGQSVAGPDHVRAVLLVAEAAAAPLFLLAVYLSSLTIGIKATAPVERIRRRQLEFTADASHELRTPVTVIEAEAELALSTPRSAAGYRESLRKVIEESSRLRHIIEDMLWLARFDSQPPRPGEEPVDLALIADQCAARFRAVADTRSLRLVIRHDIAAPALVKAPPEWIDRLLGVLIDNACRFSPPGGTGHGANRGDRPPRPRHGRGRWPRHPRAGTRAPLRPFPPGHQRVRRSGAGPSHRGRGGPLHGGDMAHHEPSRRRGAHAGVLAWLDSGKNGPAAPSPPT